GEMIPIDDSTTFEEKNIESNSFEAYFHSEGVAMGERFSEKHSFRTKNVLAYDYLSSNYRFTPEDIELENERIEVITVLNDDTYLFEFVRLEEGVILVQ